MKKLKLNLEQLSEEMELLDIAYQRELKGGTGDGDGGYGEYGNFGGYGTPENPIVLPEVEIGGGYGGYGSTGGGGGYMPPFWWPTGPSGGIGGYTSDGIGGYGGYGGWPTNHYQVLNEKFETLLDATGTTASAFSGIMGDVHKLSTLGDFAEEAKDMLKSIGKYSGYVGTAVDLFLTAYEMMEDGRLTQDEVVDFVTDQVIGGALGSIPFAGGFLATVYDISGADDTVKREIRNLIQEHF